VEALSGQQSQIRLADRPRAAGNQKTAGSVRSQECAYLIYVGQ
jgi:hypothetical protein